MRRPSSVTVVVVSVAVGLVGSLATNTIQVPAPWWPPVAWSALCLLVVAALVVEARSRSDGAGVVAASELVDAAGRLARAVGGQWRLEQEHRKVHHPSPPLPIRWHPVAEPFADYVTGNSRALEVDPGSVAYAGRLDEIVEVYQRIPSGRLVVLGQAGSGKTVLGMRLVLDLLAVRGPDDPVPVIFSVGSWNPGTVSLRSWLTTQLLRDHPGLEATGPSGVCLAAELLDDGRILPLLDGFDEIAAEVRGPALESLNATAIPLILTSRLDEYTAAAVAMRPLTAAAAIELDDLTLDDLSGYLPRTKPHNPKAWGPVLDRLRHDPAAHVLRQVLATPLMVFLARAVYSDSPGRDPVEMLDTKRFDTPRALVDHLLDSFVPAVYPRRPLDRAPLSRRRHGYWDADLARHWLRYLARHCDGPDLAWWKLGNTIPRHHRALAFGLAHSLIGALSAWALAGPRFAAAGGLMGAVGGGMLGWSDGVAPLRVQLRVRGRAKQILRKIGLGLLFGLLVVLLGWPAVMAWGWFALPVAGAIAGGLAGLAGGMTRGAEPPTIVFDEKLVPGMAMGVGAGLLVATVGWSAQVPIGTYGHWIAVGLAVGLAKGLTHGLSAPIKIEAVVSPRDILTHDRTFTIFTSSMFGLTYGLLLAAMTRPITGLVLGPMITIGYGAATHAWGRWLIVSHLWLPLTGRLPWTVMAYLEDAHQRGLLRQSGAVYQFRHTHLQDRLAGQR